MLRIASKMKSLGSLLTQSALDRVAVASTKRVTADTVLIVRADAIGDFIIWLSAAERLVALYRPRRIVLVANRILGDLAEASGLFNEVVSLDTGAFVNDRPYRFAMLRKVRAYGAAIAIQPTYSRNFWIGDSLVLASGAPERIGYDSDLNNIRPWQKRLSDRWYSRLIPANPRPLHELQRNAEFLRGLGDNAAQPKIGNLPPVAELPDKLRLPEPYFIIVPGAGSERRVWPVERYASLARDVAARTGLRLVVCGSPGELQLAEDLANQSGLDDALVLAGRTTLPELVELIRHAALLIANDSSAVHISASVGTQSVCLLGGGHFSRFMPYPEGLGGQAPIAVHKNMTCFGCNWQCSRQHAATGPFPCITTITLQDVIDGALNHLDLRERI